MLKQQPQRRQKSLAEGGRGFLPCSVFSFGIAFTKTDIALVCCCEEARIFQGNLTLGCQRLSTLLSNFILTVKSNWIIPLLWSGSGSEKITEIWAGSLSRGLRASPLTRTCAPRPPQTWDCLQVSILPSSMSVLSTVWLHVWTLHSLQILEKIYRHN